ncbi:MAG: hypothetical protein DCC58_16180 [Chloroflexi bacterium]|nr:MAG: hypothetical protein DCC58_16180 [Chloroflexota bacterium]
MLSLIEISRRRLQFGLIASIFALIAYLILMINGLGAGLNELAGSALLNMDADAIAYSENAGLSVIRSELSQAMVDAVGPATGARATAPLAYVAATYRLEGKQPDSVALLGYDPGTIAEPPVTAGRALTAADTRGALADKTFLDQTGLKIGVTVTVNQRLEQVQLTIVGEIDEGAFFFQPAVYILRPTLLDLKYGATDPASRPVASIVLVQGPERSGVLGEIEVVDKQTAFANIEGVSGQSATVRSLQVFGFLIGTMVIGVFFYVLTLQKEGQIGMLKAVGASNRYVMQQLLLQVGTIAVLGMLVAIPLAVLTERSLKSGSAVVPVSLSAELIAVTTVLLLVTSIVGALFSMRKVLAVDPIIALGRQQ